ncbi:hypothetical protein K439DRAFT_1336262, partial [Ramaria rubella]
GHAFTGKYYTTNVPENETGCPCGATLQTWAHILQECPRYDEHRHILKDAVARPDTEFKVFPTDNVHIADILGTPNGITALASFIEASGAFTKTGSPPKEAVIEQTLDAALEASDAGDPE